MSINPGHTIKSFASIVSLAVDSSIDFETLAIFVLEIAISDLLLILFPGSIT